jgi:membrane-associated PAP2 superfamily phosphatase
MRQPAASRAKIRGGRGLFTGFTPSLRVPDDLMNSRFVWAHLWWPLLAMSLLIAAWTVGHRDLWLADRLYAWQGGRWAMKHAFLTEDIIHIVGRNLSLAAWLGVLACFVASRYRKGWSHLRKPLGYLLLATLVASLLVAWVKSWSNVDCPWDLLRYGGERPYIDLFSLRPVGLSRGACFPAGHASGGYAWFALYFYFRAVRPAWRWYGFATGLVLGLTFGFAQQLRGAHFLSHDLWTATLCWVAVASVSLAFWPRAEDAKPMPRPQPLARGAR